ncbi:hypothetical protein [Thiobacillus denitrificans]|uniref:hypothetical protein n=1 Tax=Thiobacillus denitrificans TaxID=36861 RepID=UPI000360B7D3|nr:hypothetical protein [Thiobacillus denitrificans]
MNARGGLKVGRRDDSERRDYQINAPASNTDGATERLDMQAAGGYAPPKIWGSAGVDIDAFQNFFHFLQRSH